jgi:hypothetical protein
MAQEYSIEVFRTETDPITGVTSHIRLDHYVEEPVSRIGPIIRMIMNREKIEEVVVRIRKE